MEKAVEEAKKRGFRVGALELTSESRSVYTLEKGDFPLAIIVGNEITGVSKDALELIDFTIDIPMLGAKHSLNVAVSYGIVVYEALRVYADEIKKFRP
jgi:tRNA G18 (ribose-2'-O)-methylase SpoU